MQNLRKYMLTLPTGNSLSLSSLHPVAFSLPLMPVAFSPTTIAAAMRFLLTASIVRLHADLRRTQCHPHEGVYHPILVLDINSSVLFMCHLFILSDAPDPTSIIVVTKSWKPVTSTYQLLLLQNLANQLPLHINYYCYKILQTSYLYVV